jgi:hypothetical protein
MHADLHEDCCDSGLCRGIGWVWHLSLALIQTDPKPRRLTHNLVGRRMFRGKASRFYRVEARNPYGDTPWNLIVTEDTMNSAKARGPGAVEDLKWNVSDTARNPIEIFRGVREGGENRWLCYAGRPKFRYDVHGHRVPSSETEIFLVFVNERQIVYTYRWENSDPEFPDLPNGHSERFDTRFKHDACAGIDQGAV